MRARDVMTRAMATTTPETTVEKVAKLLINLRISGVPVLDRNGQLVGIVTEGDLLRRVETGTDRQRSRWSELFSANSRLAEEYIKSHARRIEDIMTREVVSVEELASLGEIAELMETKRIKRVPVVHNGKIVGIVSRADLLQVLASGGTTTADEDSDRLIRERLLAELRKQEWANPAESNVVVSDGVVHFWGTVGSQEEGTALRFSPRTSPVSAGSRITRSQGLGIYRRSSRRFEPATRRPFLLGNARRSARCHRFFLSKASSYGTAVEPVEIIQTHVSLVFLAGDCAYKLKRAMKFPYLDFSTVEQRPGGLRGRARAKPPNGA